MMNKFKHNLVNKRFGDLIALHRVSCLKTKRTAWLCKCACGTKKIILQQSLLSGAARSCGCGIGKAAALRKEKKIQKGVRFGKLKVLDRSKQDQWGNWLYKCQCDCGNIHITKGTFLRCGNTKSCGCGQIDSVTTHGRSQTKEYRRNKSIQSIAKRRAIKANQNETFSQEEIRVLLMAQGNKCHYCQEDLKEFHRDHKIPLCREGRNTIKNIALSCPSCNYKKNRKTEKEFFYFLESKQGQKWLTERNSYIVNKAT